MPIPYLPPDPPDGGAGFPPADAADELGVVAVGGDLGEQRLLEAYRSGIFPWPHPGLPLLWFSPDPRTVLPLQTGALHVPRRLDRTIRSGRFEVRLDTAFRDVIEACATVPRAGQDGTWITEEMIEAYRRLHGAGYAHCAESYLDGRLVGGVYGVAVGGFFSGESMFHRASDASKVALVTLLRQLRRWGFRLFDAQMSTPLVQRLGFEEWPRDRFLATLDDVVSLPDRTGRWRLGDPP